MAQVAESVKINDMMAFQNDTKVQLKLFLSNLKSHYQDLALHLKHHPLI